MVLVICLMLKCKPILVWTHGDFSMSVAETLDLFQAHLAQVTATRVWCQTRHPSPSVTLLASKALQHFCSFVQYTGVETPVVLGPTVGTPDTVMAARHSTACDSTQSEVLCLQEH